MPYASSTTQGASFALAVGSLDELAAKSRARPGALSYSALAIPMQIVMEQWKKKTGADLVFVPVRGGADMVTGLLTGTTPVAIVGLPNFLSYIRDGTVTALAVDSEERSPLLPAVPTLRELGYSEPRSHGVSRGVDRCAHQRRRDPNQHRRLHKASAVDAADLVP